MKVLCFIFFISCLFTQDVISQSKNDACAEWKKFARLEENKQKFIKKAISYKSKINESCKLQLYIDLAFAYREQHSMDSARYYFDKTISLSKKIKNKDTLTLAYVSKAAMQLLIGEKDKGLNNLEKAHLALKDDPSNVSWVLYYQTYANYLDLNNEYQKAIKYTDSSIAIARKYNHDEELAICYLNSTLYHIRIADYEEALASSFKALDIVNKTGNNKDIETTYYFMGLCYINLKQYDTAVDYLYKSINRSQEVGNDAVKIYSYNRIVTPLKKIKRYSEGNSAIDSLIAMAQRMENETFLATGYEYKADILIEQKKYNDAEKILLIAREEIENSKTSLKKDVYYRRLENLGALISLAKMQKDFPKMLRYIEDFKEARSYADILLYRRDQASFYSEYYEGVNKPKQALAYYKEWVVLKDSILNEEKEIKVAELEKKYDTNKKELEIAQLNEEKALQEVETKKAETKQYFFLGIAIITLLALITGLIIFLKIKKQQRALQKAHKEVTKLNKVKDHLFSILAHDLRGMILPFQRVGKILKYHIRKGNYEKTEELAMELERNSQNLSDVLNNLLNWSLEQMNNYKVNLTKMSVTQELEEIVDGFKQHSSYKNTVIELDCDTKDILFDKGAFHLIFRNLIGNALKYTEDGIIKIIAINRDNDITFTIEDNGIGISKEKASKIFSLEKEQSTAGTKGEKGTGLGLNLVHRFVKLHKGSIDVTPRAPKGTSFNLFFPDCAEIKPE